MKIRMEAQVRKLALLRNCYQICASYLRLAPKDV
jgi:hypothetical protein